jgi:hypothetical protein
MSDQSIYTYRSPLEGYENAPELPDKLAEDGKSYINNQTGILSSSYTKFPSPIDNGIRGGL